MSDYFDSHAEFITGGTNMENALQQAYATVFTATATNKQTSLIADGLHRWACRIPRWNRTPAEANRPWTWQCGALTPTGC